MSCIETTLMRQPPYNAVSSVSCQIAAGIGPVNGLDCKNLRVTRLEHSRQGSRDDVQSCEREQLADRRGHRAGQLVVVQKPLNGASNREETWFVNAPLRTTTSALPIDQPTAKSLQSIDCCSNPCVRHKRTTVSLCPSYK